MRMDGDPHLTAWGSLDAEPIGGQRAMDLIPQQVVGGYFLMGTEEKGRVTQPSRPGIPEEQGGPVPVSCQGGEPLLQPLGVLEGGLDQAGEENAPLALSTLDSSLDSAQNPSSYCTFESPSETAPAPLSPDPLSQLPDQNVISPTHSPPEEDHPSEYLLDVLQLLVPGPALPPDTDSLPHCPPAPARQMLVPHDGLLDLDKTLLFASETRQSDCKPLCFDYLTPETDQIPPAECLPRIDDHSLSSEAPVDPFTGHFPRSDPLWDLDVVEWPQSESNLDFGAVESSRLDSDAAQLPPSESCLEPDTVQLPRSVIRLNFDADRWSQSRFCSDPLPQSECCLNSDVDELPEAETCLELSAAELPEADSCVLSDANDLDEAEAFLDLEGDLPEAEACLNLMVSELPESDTYLSPGIGDLPEAESFALHDVRDLPEAESFLSPEVGEWPEAEAGLNTGSESTEAASGSTNFIDYLSQPVSCLHSDVDQLPQSDSCLDSEQLSQAESCLHPDTNQFSCLNPKSDLLPLPTSDADQLPQIESHLHSVAHPKSHVDHNIHHLISSLAPGSEQLAQSDGILDQDTNKLPQATACSDTDSNLLLPQMEYCLHPGSCPLPTFHSFVDPESNQITQSESLLNSDVDQIDFVSQSESSLAADIVFFPRDEPCAAPEMLSQSDLGQNSDHPTQSECCLNSQSEQVLDACLDHNTKQLARCDSNLSLKIDRWPLSDSCSQPDPNHLAQSDCLISPAFVPCSESEHCLNTDNLSQFNSYLELDTVQFSQTEFSLVLSGCESPNSGLSPVIDHSPQSGLCLHSDTELLPLSETFLAHENDKLICSVSESDSGLMSQSETSSSNDQMPLFSDFADEGTSGSEATHSDHLVICENPLTHNSDQLPMAESGLCDDSEFYCLCETFLAIDTDPISLPGFPEAPDPDHLSVSESVLIHGSDQIAQSDLPKDTDIDRLPLCDSVLACDADHFHVGKSFLPQDALPFTMTDHLAEIRDTCLDSDSGGLLKLHSCLNDDSDQVSVSISSHIIHELPLPDSPLPSPADQLPPSEPFFAFETADRLPLCNSSVANTSHLPSLESYLGLDHDNFDSNLPLSGDTDQFIESSQGHLSNQSESFHDLDLLPLSECLLAPNLDDLNLSDLCFTPDIDEFPLGVTSVDPDNEISLFDEFLACDAHQSLQPESIATPTRDEFGLFESCLSNDADRSLLSHMSVLPHKHQLPFSDANVLLEEVNAQSCQSLISSNVDHPLSESFLESSTGQLPQSVSYLASDVDQPESAYRSSLVSASHFAQMTPANTSFSNSIVEEFQISWDWTSDLDHAEFTGVGLDCGSDVLLNLCPDGPASQVHEMNDCLPLFCLDTPPESPIDSPEIDPLTLSDDLLSLCDVFSQLQANNDITCPEIVDGDLCCSLDGLSLQQTDSEFRTDQVSRIEEEMSQLGDPQVVKLPHMPTPNGQVDSNVGGDQTSNGISDHYLLDHDVDQSESYCLDLLFEPKLDSCEMQSSPSSSPPVNPCPQLHFDPSFGSIISAKVAGHLRCDVTKPSQSHVDETQSTPPLESLCFGDNLPPACHSDPSLHNMLLAQSNSYVATEMGSTSELLGESVQLPSIVGKEPLDGLTENNQDVLLARSREALPPDKLVQPELDTSIEDEAVSPCDLKGPVLLRSEEPDCSQVFARLSGSGEQIPLEDTTHSKPNIGFESPPSLPGGEQIEKLALSHTASPLDNTQVLPCDSHHPADSQDSASAPFSFGEGDPFLGFALDNDSPCVGDELARLRAVFDALDRDKDGFVKMEDFVQFATVYGAEQVKYLTGYLDPAGLGVINFRDFYRGISEIQNEDLDMQLYDMGYPSEGEPACSVDFDDLAAFEVTEVTDSAYVGSESAYSECETFTDEDTGGLAAQEDPETEGDGAGSRRHTSASPEGLELSLCDISVVTVAGQEEQFEDFGEGAEPDLFNSHCEDEPDSFTQTSNSTQRLTSSGAPVSERQLLAPPPCPALGGLYCSQCHKHINRLEDLSTRLRYLEMDSPDKRTCSRKEARRLHNSGFLGEEAEEEQETHMAYDETDLTDKVLYLEQRVSELERDAATTSEQQNRLRQENLQLLHRVHALEEQLKDQELLSDEVQSEETRKHRDELRKVERDRGYELSSLKARLQELENENTDLRSQLPSFKATTQRLEEEKYKLLDQVEDLQRQLQDHQDQNRKLGGKLSKELHKQQTEKERCQEIIEELRRELEQMQLIRLEMEQKMGLGNSAALQEYNSRTREAELEQEVRRLKQEQRALKEQNEELNGQIINLSIQGAKNLFSTTFSDSLAAEISSVSRDELMEAIQKQEEINLRLQDYIDRIIVAIMETNPAILEVKFH